MDRLVYTAMTGASHILEQQATVAHNLANVSTTGFRAQLDSFRAVPVIGGELPTRAFVVDATVGADFSGGSLQLTGRELDVAIQGSGWLAVEKPDGSEGLTRNGSLKTDENGVLQTQDGLNVLGEGGPITIPPGVGVTIGKDGTISSIPSGSQPNSIQVVGRLKLVNPPESNIVRGDDGLFKTKDGSTADADPTVSVAGSMLESSNVNAVECMVSMINLGRNFEMQMKLMTNAENNATKATQILSLS
ncbi:MULTISPECIES: flagellar basal-body rod protein FlgF [unclassified Undibacterium]|uniref:flagellar basal-body rod protein FlgF n=1 Tax=unclassified Undibacterium TaxID=2630295 RepID=UPI002AC98966|nr:MULTISPECIES: flagellar basal-body rod protein FlgF [unclassified Undibacterium]MEB0138784.1 flagellar basal-body rod protein FlgF [Undibacterium sp. CCC2.1]MEB0170740.1 flagellar basal-body rod protein FlgF [Undibacterium sp. CCC1.1]MEB0174629.1 flagellar basal-body rod protein FlgF [Undibacterium sp. CCC3.4]MEB0213826.1 flagellar basal-body rod protein FlgF [Undibacterium sp. 5I2]WPX42552.1 flagellar basal-body rod protein FlgF [Undibacterium sp. CCC3.4]